MLVTIWVSYATPPNWRAEGPMTESSLADASARSEQAKARLQDVIAAGTCYQLTLPETDTFLYLHPWALGLPPMTPSPCGHSLDDKRLVVHRVDQGDKVQWGVIHQRANWDSTMLFEYCLLYTSPSPRD